MSEATPDDPWTRWYAAYQTLRARERADLARKRAANTLAGLLVGYMLAGGAIAGLAVKLVMAN